MRRHYELTLSISLTLALAYWYLWARLLPRWFNYRLEEQLDILDDGTTITRIVRVQN